MQHIKKHFHFIGISGIGMSGLAKIMKQQDHIVSGCDTGIDNKHIHELQNLGCSISSHHQSAICNDPTIDTTVYTSSVPSTHPELEQARKNNISILHRSELLAQLMSQQISIAIAGSHGKTSTTALISHIFLQANYNPTIIIGGHSASIKSNAQYGTGDYLIAETDESDRSFLILPKKYGIVTNIDIEHLETYKNFDDIKQSFLQFINSTQFNGMQILCIDDKGVQSIISQVQVPYITYGQSLQAEVQARNIQLNIDNSVFEIYQKSTNTTLGIVTLSQPGIHYVLNATGAVALALHLKIPFSTIQTALATFNGVDRRFSFCGISTHHGAYIFNDYGHHPLEIHYALTIARKKAKKNLVVVFQPHRFTRTKFLWNDFINVLSQDLIDTLIITDIFAASETPIETVTSKRLVEEINQQLPHKKIIYCPFTTEMADIKLILDQTLQKDDLLLLLGAGKVNKLEAKLIL